MIASAIPSVACETRILHTHEQDDLDRITSSTIQAVIYTLEAIPEWIDEVSVAVEQQFLQIPRTILPAAEEWEIAALMDDNLPSDVLTPKTRMALKQDVLELIQRIARLTGAVRFHFRIFTGEPTSRCGFHVDTVAPGTANWGLLRLFNGAGTEYANPEDVVSMRHFYAYLSRRERLEREHDEASVHGITARVAELDLEILALDEQRAFMNPNARVQVAPCPSIVAFKHLDVTHHWSEHSKALAWVHCSPMVGKPRLVVNVTAAGPRLRTTPRGKGASFH